MPVYYEKYIKTKVKEFNGAVNTNFYGYKVPKESVHYNYKGKLWKWKKQELFTSLFRRMHV